MIPIEYITAVLLCAGQSHRFGPGNKLLAPYRGKPLVSHAAGLLGSLPFADRLAVVPGAHSSEPLRALLLDHGFRLVDNPRPEDGQDVSVRLGIEAALARHAKTVLICLGDMPAIDRPHLLALAEAADVDRAAISSSGTWQSPPVLLPAGIARAVLASPGKRVRNLLADAPEVRAPANLLADCDLPDDFDGPKAVISADLSEQCIPACASDPA